MRRRVTLSIDVKDVHRLCCTMSRNAVQMQHRSRPKKPLSIYVCGEGSAGELGLGPKNATNVKRPRLNPHLKGTIDIAAGGMHAVALTADHRILTWGVNDQKALGRDTTWDGGLREVKPGDEDSDSDSEDGDLNPREATPTAIPVDSFPPGTEFVQVAAGDSASFAVTSDGHVYGWGAFRDMEGKLRFTPDSTTNKETETQAVPLLIPNLKNIKHVAVGADFALALDAEGRVYAWGTYQQHQLGRRVIERRRQNTLIPQLVGIPKRIKIVSIHTGIDHAFAIDSNGDTWAWGLNNYAQTGLALRAGEGEAIVPTPQRVPALVGRNMKAIEGGRHHSIGVTQGGECLVWGRMDGGQMGIAHEDLPLDDATKVVLDDRGRPRILLQPTLVPIGNCMHVAAGSDHCIAVTADGRAYSWGLNATFQCGQGNVEDDILVAKLIESKDIKGKKICWAGGGGQYSALASY